MDVTSDSAVGVSRRRPRLRVVVAVALVLGALGFLMWKGLDDASVFFYNADEAVDQRDELGERRFRLQGTVVDGTVTETGVGVAFVVTFGGVDADVAHVGNPPELFQPDIPVVLEGQWDEETFVSDRIMVRHSSEYESENEDRLRDAGEGGASTGDSGGGAPE